MGTHHVIIGGGPAATNCLETIRQCDDANSRITLISDEPAHSRMALPYWLSGKVPREHVLTADMAYYQSLNIEPRIGVRVERVNAMERTLRLSDNSSLGFDNLFIATGSSPVQLPVSGAGLPGVQPLWSLAHTQSLLESVAGLPRPRVVLVGAGFIGFIMLNAMYKRGWRLAVIEREAHVLPRMLDAEPAKLVESWLASKGIDLHCGVTVQAIHAAAGASKQVELSNGSRLDADMVILATGIKPNVDCLRDSGTHIDQGIVIDDRCQTNVPGIYAGGDVAQGPVLYSEKSAIHAIQTTAVDHGRVAGANMAGREVRYPGSLLMNILDACGLQCASFGNWADPKAQAMTINSPAGPVYRSLRWVGDQITSAIFIGKASDLGMLNDVGMVKGILQTQTPLGDWKKYLAENPFDIRRPFVAARVPDKLARVTLLGTPARARQFRFRGAPIPAPTGDAHSVYVHTK